MAKKYLDYDGLSHFWDKLKLYFSSKAETVTNITRSGTTFTATRADNTTFTFTQQDNTVSKTTTIPKAPGTAAIGSENAYAAGDHVHPAQSDISGNAGTATTLETARKIDGVSFDGSADIIHYGTCSTASGTVAKVVSCTGFVLVTGAWIAVTFTNGNTAGNPTLNVNSTGARTISYKSTNISQSLAVVLTNSTYLTLLLVYDGTYYQIVGTLDIPYSIMTQSEATTGTSTTARVITPKVLHDTISGFGGIANGFAPLDSNSKVDSQYLPSYVDDVIEAYAVGSTPLAADWLSLTASGSALTPETGKIYILMVTSGDYDANTQFRWGGTTYVKLNDGGVSSITNSEIDTIMAS